MSKDTHTPVRSIRVPEDVWRAAQDRAASEGTTASEVVVKALRRYGRVMRQPSR